MMHLRCVEPEHDEVDDRLEIQLDIRWGYGVDLQCSCQTQKLRTDQFRGPSTEAAELQKRIGEDLEAALQRAGYPSPDLPGNAFAAHHEQADSEASE